MAKTEKQPTSAASFFGLGDEFWIASKYLSTTDPGIEVATPNAHITCAAYASEAYLKCLLKLEDRKFEGHHNLASHFGRLTPTSKRLISKWWQEASKTTLDTHRHFTNPNTGKRFPISDLPEFKMPKNLQEALEQSKDAFIEFRYHTKLTFQWSLLNFPFFVRRRILQLKPEWKSSSPRPGGKIFQPNPYLGDGEYD
jgi:hypothetical protein